MAGEFDVSKICETQLSDKARIVMAAAKASFQSLLTDPKVVETLRTLGTNLNDPKKFKAAQAALQVLEFREKNPQVLQQTRELLRANPKLLRDLLSKGAANLAVLKQIDYIKLFTTGIPENLRNIKLTKVLTPEHYQWARKEIESLRIIRSGTWWNSIPNFFRSVGNLAGKTITSIRRAVPGGIPTLSYMAGLTVEFAPEFAATGSAIWGLLANPTTWGVIIAGGGGVAIGHYVIDEFPKYTGISDRSISDLLGDGHYWLTPRPLRIINLSVIKFLNL